MELFQIKEWADSPVASLEGTFRRLSTRKDFPCIVTLLIAVALAAFATAAIAQEPAVYPAKKQTAQQQKKDDGQCLAWANKDTESIRLSYAACMEGRGYTVK